MLLHNRYPLLMYTGTIIIIIITYYHNTCNRKYQSDNNNVNEMSLQPRYNYYNIFNRYLIKRGDL